MPIRWDAREHFNLGAYVVKWFLILLPVAATIGSGCAFFLWSLNKVTELQWQNPWLLFLLPLAGMLIGWVYHKFGGKAEGGNNLIVEQIHEHGAGVPARMAPLVLFGTLLTHLFGGSAGREGTAVQIGGSVASSFCRWIPPLRGRGMERMLLMAGIAAGFGAVFGTPLTGAIFAMEVLAVGKIGYEALLPCLISSVIGDWTCTAWGIGHTSYHIELSHLPHLSLELVWKVSLASVAFGLASLLFAELAHGLHYSFKKLVPSPALRPALGGCIVIALVYLVGCRDYLGLGVTSPNPEAVTIVSSFSAGGAHTWSWLWKIVFTCVTISSGFKGGEVTPLFFVGAALGNTLAHWLGAPVDLFAGLGFVAVFSGAANTPLACTIMGIELFGHGTPAAGSSYVVYFALACFLSYMFSGHSGIYLSQKIATPKFGPGLSSGMSLRSARELLPSVTQVLARRARDIFKKRE